MTGGEATFGISTHQGVMLAVKEQQCPGGRLIGKQIKLIESVDDQGKPEDAVTAVSKLITQDHVIAIARRSGKFQVAGCRTDCATI